MEDDLPTEYDMIVIGTGMTESIVAAAASRIGKKVLHLDSDDHYGGMWASFNFENMLRIIERANSSSPPKIGVYQFNSRWYLKKILEVLDQVQKEENLPQSNMSIDQMDIANTSNQGMECEEVNTNSTGDGISNESEAKKEENVIIPKKDDPPNKDIWTRKSLLKEYRKFNIDLAPKLLFARGELVELLISSNIARYSEFRCVNRVLTWFNETLHPVPCSRADVFATKYVSVVEKRMLMKVLTSLMEFEESKSAEYYDKETMTFLEYLKKKKLSENVVRYILYAIAGASDTTLCQDGILRCKKFLTSLGRYGNTPLLWSMYGCGELPQGFCRLCAVYGGIYYLNRPVDKIESGDDGVTVTLTNKELKCEHLVMAIHKAPDNYTSHMKFQHGISRAIFIMNSSILPIDKESLTLLQFPPLPGKKYPVSVIELGPSTCSVPNGLYMLHMTCKQTSDAETDLRDYAEKLLTFEECDEIKSNSDNISNEKFKPKVLWSVYFNMTDTSSEEFVQSDSSRVFLCSGPDTELDFDKSVIQAREIFKKIYNDAEFLPRAPDPDEIVFDGEESNPGPVFEKNVVADEHKDIANSNKMTENNITPNDDLKDEMNDSSGMESDKNESCTNVE